MIIFIDLLRSFDNLLNETVRTLVVDYNFWILLNLIVISFLYGVIHSIGPGHGKALVMSFFLKEKHPLRKSLILASIISIIHTGSALILSLLFYFFLTSIKGFFRIKIQSYFMLASGILIVIIGILFLFFKIFIHKNQNSTKTNNKNLILVGISAGIIPCPVALMIMLFTLSKNIPLIGLLSIISISLGMFFLLSIIGFLSIKSRDGIIKIADKITKKGEKFTLIIEYLSVFVIIIIGFTMIINVLSSYMN